VKQAWKPPASQLKPPAFWYEVPRFIPYLAVKAGGCLRRIIRSRKIANSIHLFFIKKNRSQRFTGIYRALTMFYAFVSSFAQA
jgi:hypothetical protein